MLRRLLTVAICGLSLPLSANDRVVQSIHGVYEARLSGYCKSVTEAQTVATSGDFRVRKGGNLTASGNRHTIFVDDGATANVTGQGSTIFVARGGLAIVGGQRNQVFTEPGGRVTVLGTVALARVGELDLKVNRNAEDCQ